MKRSLSSHFGLSLLGPPVASSDEVAVSAPDRSPLVPSDRDSLLADAAYLAADENISLDSAMAVLRRQTAFGLLTATLRSGFPSQFADAWTDVGDYSLHIGVVGPPLRTFQTIVDKTALDITIHGGFPETEADLMDRKARVSSLLEKELSPTPFSVTFDAVSGKILATLPQKTANDTAIQALLNAPDLKAFYVEGPIAVPMVDVRGGARMTGSQGFCTSGFSVSNSDGRSGISTAGHCRGITSYIGPGGNSVPANIQDRHQGRFGDVEWFGTPEPEVPECVADDSGEIRPVNEVFGPGTINRNDYFCKFGITAGYGCSRVFRISGDCNHPAPDGLISDLAIMDDPITRPGDSGGPWFIANSAAGLTSGRCDEDGQRGAAWTKANKLPEAIGMLVKRRN